MEDQAIPKFRSRQAFPAHGFAGLALIAVFWILNWSLAGLRTHWGFFPLWLGYCLSVDALTYYRTGTSLLMRSWRKYTGLFLVSAPVWWIFEAINWRLMNWQYDGGEFFTPFQFWLWATLSFTTVIPAVFGTTELVASFNLLKPVGRGPVIRPARLTTLAFFITGLVMFGLMMAWPRIFFPFIWLSIYFVLEPLNVWQGNRSLTEWTRRGDWRPVLALWTGVLVTAFFWEMWNFFSYPKWIYSVPWGGCCKIFEMPLFGYGGYLPFSLELYAMYHLVVGLFGEKRTQYVKVEVE
ncbi:MAG TPA: hypothetical protein VGA03_08450 [Anaerolineales bacterium]